MTTRTGFVVFQRVCLGVLCFSLLACALACESPAKGDTKGGATGEKGGDSADSEPVVIIEGEVVTRGQYEDALFDRFAENHLESYIEMRLIEKKAKEMSVVADEAKIKAEVAKNVDTLLKTRFGGNEANMRQALQERNMSLEGWRKDLSDKARRDQLLDEMLKKTRGADSEAVKKRFEQKYGEEGLKYRVRHILISTKVINTRFYSKEEWSGEKDKIEGELKALGAQVLSKLGAGEDFAALAKAHSDDYTANRGGDLGEAWKGRFGKEFDDAVRGLQVGKRSNLVRAKRGYHVIEVTKINPGVEYQGAAILVSTGPNGPSDRRTQDQRDKDALEKITKINESLKTKKFAEVAREMSDDMATRSRGGDLGIFGRRRLGKEVDVVLEKTGAKTTTAPIKTPRGYWIVKLETRKAVPEKDRRVVRHIFLSAEYDDVKKKKLEGKLEEMARKKADDIKERVEGGGDFKALAIENTEDAYTRKAGGEYYNYRRSSLGPEVWASVQKLKPETETSLIKSNRGFHIVQVMEKTVTKFDEVKETLLKDINDQPITPADARVFLEGLKDKAKIDRKIGVAPVKGPKGTKSDKPKPMIEKKPAPADKGAKKAAPDKP